MQLSVKFVNMSIISEESAGALAPHCPFCVPPLPKAASWKLNRSEGRSDCCFWDGVECNRESSGHVIALDLSSSFLYGPINSTSSLFNLIHLRRLNLADNDFHFSQIPSRIGRLLQLENLNLSYSLFSGQVPTGIAQLTQLVSLDLTGNQLKLQGPGFRNLVQNSAETLRELFLSDVILDSEIPDILANSSSLRSLVLTDCGLSGEFPAGIFHLPMLQVLDVHGNNNLTGYLPKFHGNNKLKHLILAGTNFHGKLATSIGNLIYLTQLDLSSCNFLGPLPGSISNLTRLTLLNLSNNNFWGLLPSLENLSNLTYLSLGYNNFDRWKLPDWLGKLNKLAYLYLTATNMYGEIPSSIFLNLTQVGELHFGFNQIQGRIPLFPSTMTKLTLLSLANNQLKGPIPSSLSNLKNLEIILLSDNNISGTVEVDIFLSLEKLTVLYLGGNRITLSVINNHNTRTLPKFEILGLTSCNLRVFPEFLRFQDQLHALHLDDNNFDGLIPEWMGNTSKKTLQALSLSQNSLTGFEQHWPVIPWVGLRFLDLSYNMLHGSVPMPPPTTMIFSISNNNLNGEIPPSICELQSLQLLDLSLNNITGLIPPCLETLSNSLLVLNLRGNILRGTIPNRFPNGCKLLMINLSENQLEGDLPRSFENCTSLQILNLGNNLMEDTFPFWLEALSELQVLILRSNKFHGVIRMQGKTSSRFPKLRIIDLSYNSFSGEMPLQYFQEWSAMKKAESIVEYMEIRIEFFVSSYIWEETYSFSMKMFNKGVITDYGKILNIFIAVDLSSNKFSGKIPESIKSLSNLQLLNLSNNELVGVIPLWMGNLTHLESLDLSSNKISGNIPQELAQLNFLEFLNVSNNNLTGPIPQGGQFSTFLNTSYIGSAALCGDPLSKKCGNSKVSSKPPTVSSNGANDSDFPSGVEWVVILFGVASGLVIGLVFGNRMLERVGLRL